MRLILERHLEPWNVLDQKINNHLKCSNLDFCFCTDNTFFITQMESKKLVVGMFDY